MGLGFRMEARLRAETARSSLMYVQTHTHTYIYICRYMLYICTYTCMHTASQLLEAFCQSPNTSSDMSSASDKMYVCMYVCICNMFSVCQREIVYLHQSICRVCCRPTAASSAAVTLFPSIRESTHHCIVSSKSPVSYALDQHTTQVCRTGQTATLSFCETCGLKTISGLRQA